MRYKSTWFKYESKLATFVSFLQSGMASYFGCILPICFVPCIVLFVCGAPEPATAIMCGIMFIASIAIQVSMLFVDTDKLNDHMAAKKKTHKSKVNNPPIQITAVSEKLNNNFSEKEKNKIKKIYGLTDSDFENKSNKEK